MLTMGRERSKTFSVQKRRRSRGFSLVEALVALLVLSIGLLGIAGLQLTGMRNNQAAYLRSQAVVLADDILERMRANRGALGAYAVALADDPPTTPTTMAQIDLQAWLQTLNAVLPNGDGSIAVDGATNRVTVTTQWQERSAIGGEAPANQTVTLVSQF